MSEHNQSNSETKMKSSEWEAYLEGFKTARNTEELSVTSERAAKSAFERWKEVNTHE